MPDETDAADGAPEGDEIVGEESDADGKGKDMDPAVPTKRVYVLCQDSNQEKHWLAFVADKPRLVKGETNRKATWVRHSFPDGSIGFATSDGEKWLQGNLGGEVVCVPSSAGELEKGCRWTEEPPVDGAVLLKCQGEALASPFLSGSARTGELMLVTPAQVGSQPGARWRFVDAVDGDDVLREDLAVLARLPDFTARVCMNAPRREGPREFGKLSELHTFFQREKDFWPERVLGRHQIYARMLGHHDTVLASIHNLRAACLNRPSAAVQAIYSALTTQLADVPGVVYSGSALGSELSDLLGKAEGLGHGFFFFVDPYGTPEFEKMRNAFKDDFWAGLIRGYEFRYPKGSLGTRAGREVTALDGLIDAVSGSASSAMADLTRRVRESETLIGEQKEALAESCRRFEEAHKERLARIADLEAVYHEKLRLEAAVTYWEDFGKKKSTAARRWLLAFGGLALAVSGVLLYLVLGQPAALAATKIDPGFVRTSALILAIFSIAVYVMRAILRLAMSSLHLRNDANERAKLTQSYLAMMRESPDAVSDDIKKVIIQALYSRTDSGLLKDDGHPVMPIDAVARALPFPGGK